MWLAVGLIALGVGAFWAGDGGRLLSLDTLQARRADLLAWRDAEPLAAGAAFFGLYVVTTALSLPGAALLTLAAGLLFGLVWGTLLVSLASSLGATGAFLLARHGFREAVERRFGARLRRIDAGIARDGPFYLFALRLVPVVPFFLVNLLLGVTRMPTWQFFWVSQLGMLAGTVVYVNAGRQLAGVTAPGDILTPGLLGALALLGVFPLLARRLLAGLRRRRLYAPHTRPARFDRNLIVLGAGSGGLVSAYIAAALKARVTLIEARHMGGDCLNTGCVPSKALLRSARLARQLSRAAEFGFTEVRGTVDFARVMERVAGVVEAIRPHDSAARYEALGVECLHGHGRLVDPWTVVVGDRRLSARNIVLATGAEPFVPPIPGLAEAGFLTSETVWNLRERPARLLVLGGGAIGTELAQAFARLGSGVTLVETGPQLLGREDAEVAALVLASLRADGVDVRLDTQARAVAVEGGEKTLVCETGGAESRLAFDAILVAAGRVARLKGYGLEELGIRTGRAIEVDACLRTSLPNIYAVGDVTGRMPFTHAAAHMAWHATVNSLFGDWLALRGGRFRVDDSTVPWVTFTDPEVARVGLSETTARARGIAVEVVRYPLAGHDRALADGATEGFVKVLTAPGRDRLLGVTIVGEQAGEMLAEYVLAMRHGIGLNGLLGTVHAYPTLSEASQRVAGLWKQAHAPALGLRLSAWLQARRRG